MRTQRQASRHVPHLAPIACSLQSCFPDWRSSYSVSVCIGFELSGDLPFSAASAVKPRHGQTLACFACENKHVLCTTPTRSVERAAMQVSCLHRKSLHVMQACFDGKLPKHSVIQEVKLPKHAHSSLKFHQHMATSHNLLSLGVPQTGNSRQQSQSRTLR
eukprot:67614-Hanusia_phi.AAC.1